MIHSNTVPHDLTLVGGEPLAAHRSRSKHQLLCLWLALFLIASSTVDAQPRRLWATPFGGDVSVWDGAGSVVAMVGGGGTLILDPSTGDTLDLVGIGGEDLAFGADGKTVFYRSGNGVVKVSLEGDRKRDHFVFHDATGSSFGLTHDGTKGYISYRDGTVVIFETATGTEILRVNKPLMGRVVFHPNGSRFALLSQSQSTSSFPAYIYDITSDQPIATLGDNEVHCTFPETSDEVVTSSQNGQLSRWQISTGYRLRKRYWSLDFSGEVTSIHFTTDSTILLQAGGVGAGSTLNTYRYPGLAPVAQFSGLLDAVGNPGASIAATIPYGETLFLEPDSLKEISRLDHRWGYVDHVAFHPDGHVAAVITSDNATRIVDVQSGQQIDRIYPQSTFLTSTFLPAPNTVVTTSSNVFVKDFATGGDVCELGRGTRGRIQVLNSTRMVELMPDTIRLISYPIVNTVIEYPMRVVLDQNCMNISPDRKLGVASTLSRGFIVWELETGDTVLVGQSSRSTSGPYVIDSASQICAAVLTGDSLVDVYSLESGERLWRFDDLKTFAIFGLTMVYDAGIPRYLVATCGGQDAHGVVWDLTTGETLHRLDGHRILAGDAIALNETQRVVTRGNDSTLRIWDVRTGVQELVYQFSDYPAAFHIIGNEDAMVAVLYNGLGLVLSLKSADTLGVFSTRLGAYQITLNERRSSITLASNGSGRVEAWDLSAYLPVSVESTASHGSVSDRTSNIMIAPHPVVSTSTLQVRFSDSREQRITCTDLTGRLLASFDGNGSLDPQTFSLGVVSPLTGYLLIRAECEGDVVVKGAVVAGH